MTAVLLRGDETAALAVDDLLRLSRAARRLVGPLNASVVTERAVQEFGAAVATDATAIALVEAPETLIIRSGWRMRTPEVREGLHNAAQHAHATTVLVTLHSGAEGTDVFVQDDGCGLPEGFTPCDVPRDGRHYGLASLRQRLARVGGELMLHRNEDRGMTLRGSIRHHAPAAQEERR